MSHFKKAIKIALIHSKLRYRYNTFKYGTKHHKEWILTYFFNAENILNEQEVFLMLFRKRVHSIVWHGDDSHGDEFLSFCLEIQLKHLGRYIFAFMSCEM